MVSERFEATGADESMPPADAESADLTLARFLTTSPAALSAATSLHEGAEVAITFSDLPGDWCVRWNGSEPTMSAGRAVDPDFDLDLTSAAVRSICARADADIGDLGIAFFEHIVAREADRKIRVNSRSGIVKLARRGWLQLLARGGPRLVGWMAKKGLRGPGAVASALARLRRNAV
jgi:hypothetical protein